MLVCSSPFIACVESNCILEDKAAEKLAYCWRCCHVYFHVAALVLNSLIHMDLMRS
jgi:hypothetical protein